MMLHKKKPMKPKTTTMTVCDKKSEFPCPADLKQLMQLKSSMHLHKRGSRVLLNDEIAMLAVLLQQLPRDLLVKRAPQGVLSKMMETK